MNRHNVFWGLFFVLIGILFLSNSLGIFRISVWQLLWPAFLIALGVWTIWATRMSREEVDREEVAIPLIAGARDASVNVRYGGGRLRLAGGSASDKILTGGFAGGVNIDLDQEGETQYLDLRAPSTVSPVIFFPWAWGPRDWDFSLNDEVPTRLEVSTGGSDVRLDLRNLKITGLKLDTGASTTDVYLPENAGETRVRVSGGAMTLHLHVPQNVAARIKISGALMTRSVDRSRFPRSGGVYLSPGYDQADNRADITVDMGVGTINIR